MFGNKNRSSMNKLKRLLIALMPLLAAVSVRADGIFPMDTLHAYSPDCQMANVCLPIPAADFSNYLVFHNGSPFAAGVSGCNFDTTITYSYNTLFGLGNMGPYHLDGWSVNGQQHEVMFMNIVELVGMLNVWDPFGFWSHDASTLTIKGGAPGSDYSDMEVTVMANSTQSIIGLNLGLLPQGSEMQLPVGMNSLIAIDFASNTKDTLLVMVECLVLPPPVYFYDTIPADSLPYSICFNNTNLFGAPVSIENICPDDSGTFVDFFVDTTNFCVKYSGNRCGGTEQACIVVCDNIGICDTTYLVITVDGSMCNADSRKVVDTLLINFADTFCLDLGNVPGNVVSIENICPDESGESVDFDFDPVTNCIIYTGFAPGLDQACFLITDDYGKTWRTSEPLVGGGNIQPAIARRKDGSLVAYMRDNGPPPKRLHVSESKDNGNTWSAVKDTEIPNPGSGSDVVVLKDGTWALVNNNLEKGRHSLPVWLSDDEGKSWKWKRQIELDERGDGAAS